MPPKPTRSALIGHFLIIFFRITFSIFISLNSFGQQTDSTSKTGSIYFKPFAGWKQNGVRLKGKELKQEIYKVPAAISFYKKGNTNLILSYCLLGSGSILLLSNPQSTGILLTSFGLVTGGIVIAILSHSNYRKAAKTYNKSLGY